MTFLCRLSFPRRFPRKAQVAKIRSVIEMPRRREILILFSFQFFFGYSHPDGDRAACFAFYFVSLLLCTAPFAFLFFEFSYETLRAGRVHFICKDESTSRSSLLLSVPWSLLLE